MVTGSVLSVSCAFSGRSSLSCLRAPPPPALRNYGPTIAVQNEAVKQGCQQVLWLYGDREEITEVGTMNLFIYWTTKEGGENRLHPLDVNPSF